MRVKNVTKNMFMLQMLIKMFTFMLQMLPVMLKKLAQKTLNWKKAFNVAFKTSKQTAKFFEYIAYINYSMFYLKDVYSQVGNV